MATVRISVLRSKCRFPMHEILGCDQGCFSVKCSATFQSVRNGFSRLNMPGFRTSASGHSAILADNPSFRFQLVSVLCYTAFVVLMTFSHYRDQQRYLFTCPAVRSQWSCLIYRHISCTIALVVKETLALTLRPRLPESWVVSSGRSMPPFVAILFIFAGGLAFFQVFSNRSILDKAHLAAVD